MTSSIRCWPGLRLRPLLAQVAAFAAFSTGPAGEADAVEILRRAEEVRSPALDYAVDFRLVVESPGTEWKRRSAAYSMVAQGKDHAIVLMREPPSFYPGALLISESRYWMLMARSARPLELSPRQALDGDIANGDLARGNLSRDYVPRLLATASLSGEECYQLELMRSEARAFFPRIVCWIGKRGFRPLRFDYYGQTGRLIKTAHYEDYLETPLGLRAMRIVVENQIRRGEKTTLTFSNLRRFDATRLSFTVSGLFALRDAALERGAAGSGTALEELASAQVAPP